MNLKENFLKKEIKDKSIRIRLTEDEKNQIDELASTKGMSISDYIRYCILLEANQRQKDNK